MKSLIKAEFRKLFTVRSTYVISILTLLFLVFASFYIEGFSSYGAPIDENKIAMIVVSVINLAAQAVGIIAVLQAVHEYRYNTIIYTLTAANSRNKPLLAKALVMTAFTLVFTAACIVFAVLLVMAGMLLRNAILPDQILPMRELAVQAIAYPLGTALIALAIAFLTRHIAAAFVATFVLPGPIESLLGLLLKENQVYLPFTSLQMIVVDNDRLTPLRATMVFGAYLIVFWLAAWQLYRRRDAN